jgi:hypothetical protein
MLAGIKLGESFDAKERGIKQGLNPSPQGLVTMM